LGITVVNVGFSTARQSRIADMITSCD
jgi:hypothetical protein